MYENYAHALYTMVEAGLKPKEAVEKLREKLVAEGRENLLPHIARAFVRIAEREMNKQQVVLSVAREKDENKAKREAKDILKELGADASDLSIRIDETLIGGWRLEGREHLHDASFKKQLLSLYNRATQ